MTKATKQSNTNTGTTKKSPTHSTQQTRSWPCTTTTLAFRLRWIKTWKIAQLTRYRSTRSMRMARSHKRNSNRTARLLLNSNRLKAFCRLIRIIFILVDGMLIIFLVRFISRTVFRSLIKLILASTLFHR